MCVYQALYRKYRPSSFEDVISQQHITDTLKNQLLSGKTGHAYLFTGSRGTGKTTCARILAKALICENPKNGEPCLECELCRDMDNDRLSDIIEIDAASNGGVNDARELREAASYSPERCKYRVYIIDEVHMLSRDAFNALLKIIEEPPPHVKFILATTEIHKVLDTILSRCQRFDFRRIRTEDIAARIMSVAEKEQVSVDEDAAALIAKIADGGMRDALSIMDKCIAFSDKVTVDTVSEAAGIAGRGNLFDMTCAVCSKNASQALEIVSALHSNSKDMQQFAMELLEQIRNVMVIQNVSGAEKLIACTSAELEILKKCAADTDPAYIIHIMDMLGKCVERLGRSSSKRIELEMTFISLCTGQKAQSAPQAAAAVSVPSEDTAMLTARIAELEQQIKTMQSQGFAQQPVRRQPPVRQSGNVPMDAVTDTSKMDVNSAVLMPEWPEILERFAQVCPSVSGTLSESYGYVSNNYLLIVTKNNFFLSLLRNKENAEKLRETIKAVTGKNYSIRAKCTGAKQGAAENKLPQLMQKAAESNIPVETE